MPDKNLKDQTKELTNLLQIEDTDEICPPWWPRLLFRLHIPLPRPWPGPGPVNYPPAIDNLMANLHIHTMSYLMRDESAAQQIRGVAEEQMVNAVRNLSKDHDQARKTRAA
jgi:hypothetical protein